MNKRLLLPLLLVCTLVCLVHSVSAVPSSATTEGWIIRSAIPDIFMKQDNVSYDFHVHVFDATTGNPIVEACNCSLHIYDLDGTHLFEGYDGVASHDWDYSWDVGEGNFSVGEEYPYIIQCNGTYATDDEGGFVSSSFIVTRSGQEVIKGNALAFFILLTFVILVGTMIITMKYFKRGVNMEMDLSDLVMSYISFFVFLLFYYFSFYYWGNPFVMGLLEASLWVVGFMNLFVASIMVFFNILNRINKSQ